MKNIFITALIVCGFGITFYMDTHDGRCFGIFLKKKKLNKGSFGMSTAY